MKDIYEIRRRNLKALIEDVFAGKRALLAEKMGVEQPSFVSRLLSDKPGTMKNIGANLARKIEKIGRKPENWMDVDHESAAEVREPSPVYNIDASTLLQCIDIVRATLIEKNIPRNDSAWTEESILGLALDIYPKETEGGDNKRQIRERVREIIDLPRTHKTKKS